MKLSIEETLSRLSLPEKIALCSGADFWHTKAFPHLHIPSLMVADGPHGLRKQESATDMLGVNASIPATCFPTAASSSCSWDISLLEEIGEAIAKEAAAHGVGVILGPGANIKRNPLCGRNFEYFSEDPYLTGKLAAAFIRAAEKVGVGASLKHFALNNQEYKRFSSDSIVDERTLREIYLTGFEIAVKEGHPSTVMSAYNKINGEHCSDNRYLLTDILRKDWGFKGMVLTDWGGMGNRIKGFQAGCDLMMPGGSAYMEPEAAQAVATGNLDEADIQASASRVLTLVSEKAAFLSNAEKEVDMPRHYRLALKAAEESAVLLQNKDQLLPLSDTQKIVFIGDMARTPRYQGSGSSHINPWKLVSATQAAPRIPFVQGCLEDGSTSPALLEEAESAAKKADVAVVFAGLPNHYESEGFDRENMDMPKGHVQLIERVAAANPDTIVILSCGSPVELPWASQVKSILYMGLAGEGAGQAAVNILFGQVVPCGKLTESWPFLYEDCVSSSYYANGQKDAHYREGIYVGYRFYLSANKPVRFPFGYGLSYSTFEYSNLRLSESNVSFTITNTGMYSAKEIVQVYISPPKDGYSRPLRELKAFSKIYLFPGESQEVSLPLSDRSFALWSGEWIIPGGLYQVQVGSSCEDIRLEGALHKKGLPIRDVVPAWYIHPQGPPTKADWEQLLGHTVPDPVLIKGAFTMDNTVMEMKKYSLIMKIMYKAIESTVAKGFNGKKDYENPDFRMMMNSAADASLSGMKISGAMRNYVLDALLALANGHILKGLSLFFKKMPPDPQEISH